MNNKEQITVTKLEPISEKEVLMLDIFRNLDINGKIAAIHSFYTLACEDLLECAKQERKAEAEICN